MAKLSKKSIVLICIAFVLSLFLFSPSSWIISYIYDEYRAFHLDRSDILGYYEVRNYSGSDKLYSGLQNGIHRLELRDDGTYTYEYVSFDGTPKSINSDKWLFENPRKFQRGRRPHIILSNFAFGPEKLQNKIAITNLPFDVHFGKIRITINDDLGYYFRKEK